MLHENVNFQQFFVVVKMTESRKNQSEEWTYFTQLFIYFITVNKYRFCISVIGYINMQIMGIGYKKIYIGRSLFTMIQIHSSPPKRLVIHIRHMHERIMQRLSMGNRFNTAAGIASVLNSVRIGLGTFKRSQTEFPLCRDQTSPQTESKG